MLTIYIDEAHASDEWFLPESPDVKAGHAIIAVHKKLADRINAAKSFVHNKSFPVEMVVDSMNNEAADRYFAWPERLYIIVDGIVVYQGGLGPNDYHLEEVKEWLDKRFSDGNDVANSADNALPSITDVRSKNEEDCAE